MLSFEQNMKAFDKLFSKQMKPINGVDFTYRLAGMYISMVKNFINNGQ